jgi:L-lactate permease
MKTASIVGIILMVVGFASLAYVALPMRLMMQAAEPQNSNPGIPIVGGLALIGGIALLYVTDTRCRR